MNAEKMTITLDTEDMRTVLASVGFVVCDWKEKARDEKSGKMAHESAVRNADSPADEKSGVLTRRRTLSQGCTDEKQPSPSPQGQIQIERRSEL